jgi:NTP pyrophosphatase (non-canonical NTP hydrolase)
MEYKDFVEKLFKKDIKRNRITHSILGICSESGELADAVKKHTEYEQELDINNIEEEVGDLCFYLQALLNSVQSDLDIYQCINKNMEKLSKRYVDMEFSTKHAALRLDKAEKEE